MTLAKAVVTGSIYRAPEKRFTQNNVPVSSFVMNIGDREEMLLRVIARRTALDEVVSSLGKDDKVLVEGRLQIGEYTNKDGQKVRTADVVIENQEFADAPKNGQLEPTFKESSASVADGFVNIEGSTDEQDIPFT